MSKLILKMDWQLFNILLLLQIILEIKNLNIYLSKLIIIVMNIS